MTAMLTAAAIQTLEAQPLMQGDFGTIFIQRAELRHLDTVIEISQRTFEQAFAPTNTQENLQWYYNRAFTPQQMTRELEDSTNQFYLLQHEGTVIGYLKLQMDFDKTDPSLPASVLEQPSGHLQRIYLDNAWHGIGLAQIAMNFSLQQFKDAGKSLVYLGVWEHNPKAIRFYEKMGFTRAGSHIFSMNTENHVDYWLVKSL